MLIVSSEMVSPGAVGFDRFLVVILTARNAVFICGDTEVIVPWTIVPFLSSMVTVSFAHFMRNLSARSVAPLPDIKRRLKMETAGQSLGRNKRALCAVVTHLTSFILELVGGQLRRRQTEMLDLANWFGARMLRALGEVTGPSLGVN